MQFSLEYVGVFALRNLSFSVWLRSEVLRILGTTSNLEHNTFMELEFSIATQHFTVQIDKAEPRTKYIFSNR